MRKAYFAVVAGVLYPSGRTGTAQGLALGAAAVSWVALASKQRAAGPARPFD